ncbi:MAG: hypothetical protein OWT28_00960 [Firmicutes bacterium]|nr:hypothetical protein [Bacillota bacterium]
MAIDPMREYALPAERPTQPDHAQADLTRERQRAQEAAQTRDRLGLIGVLIFCVLIALLLVSRYATLVTNNYDVQGLKIVLSHQQTRDAALQSTVYELSSPTRILNIAENVLKMTPATPVVVGTSGR